MSRNSGGILSKILHKYAVKNTLLYIAGRKPDQTLFTLIATTLSLGVKQMQPFARKDKLGRCYGLFHAFRESSKPTSAIYLFSTVTGKFEINMTPLFISES